MALRAVLDVDNKYSTRALHEQTGVKWLDVARKERCCIDTFKALNNMSSEGVGKLFPPKPGNRELRSSSAPHLVPRLNKTRLPDNNFLNRCYQYWHDVPNEMKLLDKIPCVWKTRNCECFQHIHYDISYLYVQVLFTNVVYRISLHTGRTCI